MNLTNSKTKDNPENRKSVPMPDDFNTYLPWANTQLQGDTGLVLVKVTQDEYINIGRTTDRSKAKSKRGKALPSPTSEEDEKSLSWARPSVMISEKVVKIITTYDYNDKLVSLKFDKNPTIPRKLMKLIGLIIQYHASLTAVTINNGLDVYTLYELNTWLPISNITDVCLDDTFIAEANYHILLDSPTTLRNLSLARCKIDDNVVKNISQRISRPPASNTLSLLNLASNRITDLGASYLGNALRSNRKLYYLNLADNMITDEGAANIFEILIDFALTVDEIFETRKNHINYLKEKDELAKVILRDLKAGDLDRKTAKRKSVKGTQTPKKGKGLEKEQSLKTLVEGPTRSLCSIDPTLREKASAMAESTLGKFNNPFCTAHTKVKDDITYCLGNNSLAYLNLAYNDLSYISVKKLFAVVDTQKMYDRKPRGLVNLCIEGNPIPSRCMELRNIDEILEMGVMVHRRMSVTKRRAQTKPGSVGAKF